MFRREDLPKVVYYLLTDMGVICHPPLQELFSFILVIILSVPSVYSLLLFTVLFSIYVNLYVFVKSICNTVMCLLPVIEIMPCIL